MKEHRVRTLRVTTTNSIKRDMYSSLQVLRLQFQLRDGDLRAGSCVRVGHRQCRHQDQENTSSILQECLSCGNVSMIRDLLITSDKISSIRYQKCDSTSSEFPCPLTSGVPFQRTASLCDLDSMYSNYVLLTGDILSNWETVLEVAKKLSTFEKKEERQQRLQNSECSNVELLLSTIDSEGNTPLLIAGRRLLKEKAFDKAAILCKLLLQAGSDANAINYEGRTLLSYSIYYMDDSVDLTRTLLNGGASVWPVSNNDTVENFGNIFEKCSAFTWFLRAVIRRRKFDEHCWNTLDVISQVMGEYPTRMHDHVMRTMFHHAKCYKVLGPVFYQLKVSMMTFWTQPGDLKYLCRKTIRGALGGQGLLAGGPRLLGLPYRLQEYIALQ